MYTVQCKEYYNTIHPRILQHNTLAHITTQYTRAYYNTIHPRILQHNTPAHITTQYTRAVFTLHPHRLVDIVDMQIFYPLVYIPAHIYCGYANILSISVHTRAHILWICKYFIH